MFGRDIYALTSTGKRKALSMIAAMLKAENFREQNLKEASLQEILKYTTCQFWRAVFRVPYSKH